MHSELKKSASLDPAISDSEIEFHRVRLVSISVGNMAEKLMERLASITAMEARVLLAIGELADPTATEVSQRASLTPVQVGRCISRLKSIKLVTARPSPTDGRAYRLLLTAEGKQRYAIAHQVSLSVQQWAIRDLEPGAWRAFSKTLDLLVASSQFSEADVSELESQVVQRIEGSSQA